MKTYFDLPFEFDHQRIEQIVEDKAIQKGYCCFVDFTVLTLSSKNSELKKALTNSVLNSCDGSYIALLASIKDKRKLRPYNGPTFFNKYIYNSDTQCIIGNTKEVFIKIKRKLELQKSSSNLHYIDIPFTTVDKFDYLELAEKLNALEPRIIWVSLGAPKQEVFMYNLLPYLNKGILFGVGAALNYYSGEIRDIPNWISKFHLIWLYRLFQEPRKQGSRILKMIPVLSNILIKEFRR